MSANGRAAWRKSAQQDDARQLLAARQLREQCVGRRLDIALPRVLHHLEPRIRILRIRHILRGAVVAVVAAVVVVVVVVDAAERRGALDARARGVR